MATLVSATLALPACDSGQPGEEPSRTSVYLPVDGDPTVSFCLWFRVGSQDDPAGKEGLAALTGALLENGGTEDHSYEEILELLYPMAASYSVRVDKEMTTLTGRVHRDNLDRYVELLTAAYLRPAFSPEDFERLRSNAKNFLEKTLRYGADEELGKAALVSEVFRGTGYAHPTVGTVAGLDAITLDDVRDFYEKFMNRNNVVVGVGGGGDAELVARLEATLTSLPEGEQNGSAPVTPRAVEKNEVLLVSRQGADASISIGYPIDVQRGSRDFYALWLANSWLGEHRNSSSHLYQVIREIRGMNYGDYSYIEAFPQGGQRSMPPTGVGRRQQMFEIWIRTLPNEWAHFAIRAALRELDRLVTEGLTQEEFELTQRFLIKYSKQYATTSSRRLGYAIDDRFYGLETGHLEQLQSILPTLTRDEVNAAVKKYLRSDRFRFAILTGEAETLQAALAANEPSPITYPPGAPKPAEVLAEDEEIAAYPIAISEDAIRIVPVDEMFAQ